MTFLTQDQFKRTEKGLIVLIYSMICQFFPEIALIEYASRLKFLQRFYDQFVPIYRAEMTVGIFIISPIDIRSVWIFGICGSGSRQLILGAYWLRVNIHWTRFSQWIKEILSNISDYDAIKGLRSILGHYFYNVCIIFSA